MKAPAPSSPCSGECSARHRRAISPKRRPRRAAAGKKTFIISVVTAAHTTHLGPQPMLCRFPAKTIHAELVVWCLLDAIMLLSRQKVPELARPSSAWRALSGVAIGDPAPAHENFVINCPHRILLSCIVNGRVERSAFCLQLRLGISLLVRRMLPQPIAKENMPNMFRAGGAEYM